MDLKALVNAKRKEIAAKKEDAGGRPSKYRRRGDIGSSQQRDTAKLAASSTQSSSTLPVSQHGGGADSPAEGPAAAVVAKPGPEKSAGAADVPPLPREAIIQALRARREPITLFGETDMDRYFRYQKAMEKIPTLEIDRQASDTFGDTMRKLASGGGAGLKSLLGKVANDSDDDADEEEDEDNNDGVAGSAAASGGGGGGVLENHKPKHKGKKKKSREAPPRSDKEGFVLFHLKKYLAEWEGELNARSDPECRSMAGRTMTATFVQCVDQVKPLFKLLRRRQLAEEILTALFEIVSFLEEKEYVRAHDAYIMLAIGNAPWPMGVTNVGIHERAGRSKIFAHHVAHILNDETQRKYIQSVKRIMSFVQERHPTVPSKMVRA